MSRPFRTLFALSLVTSSVGLSGCGTIYRPMYSNDKNYFTPLVAVNKKGQPQLTAEQVLQQTDTQGGAANGATAPLAPADAGAMPPAAPAAAPDATAVPPATPTTPAIPPAAVPPAAVPPATPPPAK